MCSRLKRWRISAFRNVFWPFLRLTGPRLREIRFSYEKAGLAVAGEPIPWNADAVLVEAVVRSPSGILRKGDFQLRTRDRVPRMAIAVHPDSDPAAVRLVFRLPPIQCPTWVAVHYQGKLLGQVVLPFLSAEAFLQGLCLLSPTVFALLGKSNVACQSLAEGQCRGLSAGGMLAGPTSLLPLCDFDLRVEIGDRGTGCTESIAVPLTGAQLLGKEVSLSVVLPPWPQRPGSCIVRWTLGDRLLGHTEVRVISSAALQQSLYLAESHFHCQGKEGTAHVHHHVPAHEDAKALRPCFLIAGREPGLAALCALEVRVQFRDLTHRPLLCKDEMLVTDRASRYLPNLTAIADFQQIRAFELYSKGQLLGTLLVTPTPAAKFTSEGGFHAAADFDWTPFTEEELLDRLEKLMEPSEEENSLRSTTPSFDLAFATLSAAWGTRRGPGATGMPQNGGSR